jgi:elongator complex protein 3
MLKIYPTLVIEGTKLYDLWIEGKYEPLTTESASRLIARIKREVPPWVRIQRIQRDIPAHKISGGIKKSNLRQYVEKELDEHGLSCHCIRCREIGHRSLKTTIDLNHLNIEYFQRKYTANNSDELFLSLEDVSQDVLLGFLRLRDITLSHRVELEEEPCMIIRELRILGREAPLGQRTEGAFQHRGYGKQLIREAERICRQEYGKNYLFVLSGVGVKPYYRKLGFSDYGVYMRKKLG